MSEVSAVVFDLGGVLVDWNPRHLYESLIDDPAELDYFLTVVCPLTWHFEHDAGRPFHQTLPERAAQFPDHAHLIELWDQRYLDMISGPIPDAVAVLEELDEAGVPVYGLTNMPAEVWPRLLEAFPFLHRWRGVVVSGQDGVVKPDPAIYRLLLDRYALVAAETIFIDDVVVNVEGARREGLEGVHFRDGAQLRAELAARGLPLR